MPYNGSTPHHGLPASHDAVGRGPEKGGLGRMTRGRTIGWTLCGLLLGVLLGFAAELLRRQPAAKVEQRYVAPPASETTEVAPQAPGVYRRSPADVPEGEPATVGRRSR